MGLALGISGCRVTVVDDVCGDGILDPGEECDDGNSRNGDGCDAACFVEGVCGDAVIDPGEGCDDGNNLSGDGCSAGCMLEAGCGDGILDDGEGCDDGNKINGDGCDMGCMIEAFCGDGVVQAGEECDDGGNVDGDGCGADCRFEATDYLSCVDSADCAGPDSCYTITIPEESTKGSFCSIDCAGHGECLMGNGLPGRCYEMGDSGVPLCWQYCERDDDCYRGSVCIAVELPDSTLDGICVPDNI